MYYEKKISFSKGTAWASVTVIMRNKAGSINIKNPTGIFMSAFGRHGTATRVSVACFFVNPIQSSSAIAARHSSVSVLKKTEGKLQLCDEEKVG